MLFQAIGIMLFSSIVWQADIVVVNPFSWPMVPVHDRYEMLCSTELVNCNFPIVLEYCVHNFCLGYLLSVFGLMVC